MSIHEKRADLERVGTLDIGHPGLGVGIEKIGRGMGAVSPNSKIRMDQPPNPGIWRCGPRLPNPFTRSLMYAIIYNMKRTTMFIDEALERDLRAIAERDCRPVSGVVREALGSYVARRKKESHRLGFIAFGRSGRSDTAEVHEELLWRDPGAATSGPGPGPARAGKPAVSSPPQVSRKKRA